MISAMKVSDVIACLSAIAPPEYADESDPIGLQLGSSDSAVRTVILCVTADEQAVELARRRRAELIITTRLPMKRIRHLCFPFSCV